MFFNEMLIAIDDTLPSQFAIDVGLTIAQLDNCPVKFCVVLDPALLQQNSGFLSMCQMAEQLANDLLNSAIKRAEAAGVPASCLVLYRDTSQGIIDVANREHIDVIILGTHGRAGIARAFIRSIAEDVLRRTTTPLCVIRRPKIWRVTHRVLVPIVDDELSKVAIDYSIRLAQSFGSEVFFFTACDATASDARRVVSSAEEQATAGGVRANALIVDRTSAIPEQIVKNAVAMECDAIIMASHARDGFMRFVQGSVTEAVIRVSEMPIIVLREKEA